MADEFNGPPIPDSEDPTNGITNENGGMPPLPQDQDESFFSQEKREKIPPMLKREKDLADKIQYQKRELGELEEQLEREKESGEELQSSSAELKIRLKEAESNYGRELRRYQEKYREEQQNLLSNLRLKEEENSSLRIELTKREAELTERIARAKAEWESRETALRDMQEKAVKDLKEIEKRLQEEREKAWLTTLKAKEEESNALKVEIALQEAKVRAAFERKESELKEAREKALKDLNTREIELSKEKEQWLTIIKTKDEEYQALKFMMDKRESEMQRLLEEKEEELKLFLMKNEQSFKDQEKNLWQERETWLKTLKEQITAREQKLKDELKNQEEALVQRSKEIEQEKQKMAALLVERDKEINALKFELLLKDNEVKSAWEKKENEVRIFQEQSFTKISENEQQNKKERENILSKLTAKEHEIEEIRKEYIKREQFIEQDFLRRLKDEQQLWQTRIDAKDSEIRNLREEALSLKRQIDRENESWQSRQSIKNDEIARKEQEIKSMQAKIEELGKEWERKLSEAKLIWENQMKANEAIFELKEKSILNLREHEQKLITEKTEEIIYLRNQLSSKDAEFSMALEKKEKDFREQKASLISERENWVTILKAEYEQKVQAIQAELSQVRHQEKLLQEQTRTNFESSVISVSDLKALKLQIEHMQQNIGSKEDEIRELKNQKTQMQKEMENLQNIIEIKNQEMHEFELEKGKLENDILSSQGKEGTSEAIEQELKELIMQKDMLENESLQLKNSLSDKENKFKELEENLLFKVEQLQIELEMKNKHALSIEKEIENQKLMQSRLKQSNEEKEHTITSLQEQWEIQKASYETELAGVKDGLKDTVSNLETQLSEYKRQVKARESEISLVKSQLEHLSQDKAVLEKQQEVSEIILAKTEQELKNIKRRFKFLLWISKPFSFPKKRKF